jgi:hypothetical protein
VIGYSYSYYLKNYKRKGKGLESTIGQNHTSLFVYKNDFLLPLPHRSVIRHYLFSTLFDHNDIKQKK